MIETPRLRLRRFAPGDAAFVLALVNDPDWLANIGDRNVRSLDDARRYLEERVIAMYERLGHGMYLVEAKPAGTPIGMCGLVKRPGLDDVDIGFAFLPAWRGQGFAREASEAVLAHGHGDLGLARIVAIVAMANERSIRLLEKIGLRREGRFTHPGDAEELWLYATPGGAPPGGEAASAGS